jgi:hypothetical protein
LADFRVRVRTFDNIPFVITIKKNEHYVSSRKRSQPQTGELRCAKFPTMEFVADAGEPSGWRRITHERGVVDSGLAAAFTADNMDEAVVAHGAEDEETDRDNAGS